MAAAVIAAGDRNLMGNREGLSRPSLSLRERAAGGPEMWKLNLKMFQGAASQPSPFVVQLTLNKSVFVKGEPVCISRYAMMRLKV